jgi:threonine dehydratase
MTAWSIPDLSEVLAAQRRIAAHLRPTPLFTYPALDRSTGARVHVKHENHQPVGAFKVRGGVNLVARLSDEERERGLIAASTGNHGQSVAFAAQRFDVTARICIPERSNPVKVAAMKDLGAELIVGGADFDEARENAERLAAEHGYRYVHSGNEPDLIAGVATETLEILTQQPDIEAIIVPVGGGSGAAGACIVAKAVNPAIQVIAVQSDAARAAYLSWKERRPVEGESHTYAEGLATRVPFELPQAILQEHLDDFVLVSEEEIRAAQRMMIEATRNLIEASAAAPLAATLRLADDLRGRRVALVASGGNVSPEQLVDLFSAPARAG